MILRHPIATIKDYRRFGTTDPIDYIVKRVRAVQKAQQDPSTVFKDTAVKNSLRKIFYTEQRRLMGRQLTKEELEVTDIMFEALYPMSIQVRLGLQISNPVLKNHIKEVSGMIVKELGKGTTPEEFKAKLDSMYAKRAAATAVVATQAPATKEYNDASSSSFKSKKNVYDSIPSTRSYGVTSRVTSPETFKNGVVNMARTMDASAKQISKLLKMDAKLLEELYYDKPFLFDLYFEYSLYDDFGASHEDSGINKLIESYEYKFGVTL